MQRKHDYILKIVLVGSTAVGKSAILRRFADNQFNDFYIATIGVDFRFKSITIDESYVKLQIWDTAGQQRFKGITKSYYNNADAVVMVFDVSDSKSFDDIKNIWLNEVKTYCKNQIKMFVFCNKCDKYTECMKNSHRQFFQSQKIKYFETSARTGKSINEAFLQIGKTLMTVVPKIQDKTMNFQLREGHYEGSEMKESKKGKCCK